MQKMGCRNEGGGGGPRQELLWSQGLNKEEGLERLVSWPGGCKVLQSGEAVKPGVIERKKRRPREGNEAREAGCPEWAWRCGCREVQVGKSSIGEGGCDACSVMLAPGCSADQQGWLGMLG